MVMLRGARLGRESKPASFSGNRVVAKSLFEHQNKTELPPPKYFSSEKLSSASRLCRSVRLCHTLLWMDRLFLELQRAYIVCISNSSNIDGVYIFDPL